MSKASEVLETLTPVDEAGNQDGGVTAKTLQTELWKNKGWTSYWDALDTLKNRLDNYRSITKLPKGVNTKDLKDLDTMLTKLSKEVLQVSSKVK